MNSAFKVIPRNLMEHARSLEPNGLSEVAWPAEWIDAVLESLKDTDVAILGGDVYEERNNQMVPLSDNWYCDRITGETQGNYARRSWEKTRQYIEAYPRRSGQSLFFVIVASDEPTVGL